MENIELPNNLALLNKTEKELKDFNVVKGFLNIKIKIQTMIFQQDTNPNSIKIS